MNTEVPTIQQFMSKAPHSIGAGQPLARARALMDEHGIRHLPVVHGAALVGIVTEGDLRVAGSLPDFDFKTVKVDEVMSPFVYAVKPNQPLHEVVTTMAETKRGSAVVMKDDEVIGIFTTVDACRAVATLLRTAHEPTSTK